MKKRVLAIMMAITLAAGSLAGCSGGSKSGDSKEDIVIKVAGRYSNDTPTEKYYRQKVEEFNEMDNGIKVEMDNISTEADYIDKLRTSFANGDIPNVFVEYGGSRCLDYLEADALVDLKPYLDENDSEWRNQFYDSMWAATEYEGYEGTYAVPFGSYFILLYYNKALFEEAGVQPPETLDELMVVCEKLKEKGILPFQIGGKESYRFGHLNNNLIIKTLGIDAVDQLASRELSYDSSEMIQTYQFIADMLENGYLGEDILDTDATAENVAFTEGKAAMHYDGSWFAANEFSDPEIYNNIGVIPFPYGDESCKYYAQGGAADLFYVSKLNKSEEEIEASIEFLKYVTSPEYFRGLDEKIRTIAPVKFEKSDKAKDDPLTDEIIAIQSEIKGLRTDVQNYDPQSHMIDTVRSSLQGLAMGDSAEKCAENIMKRMEEYSEE